MIMELAVVFPPEINLRLFCLADIEMEVISAPQDSSPAPCPASNSCLPLIHPLLQSHQTTSAGGMTDILEVKEYRRNRNGNRTMRSPKLAEAPYIDTETKV